MIHIDIYETLLTGTFGTIKFGLTKNQLKQIIGSPEDWSRIKRREKESRIWKYGDFEVWFKPPDWTVYAVFVDNFTIPLGGKNLNVDCQSIRGEMSRIEVEKILDNIGVEFYKMPPPSPEQELIRTSTGVSFGFVKDDVEEDLFGRGLHMIHWSFKHL